MNRNETRNWTPVVIAALLAVATTPALAADSGHSDGSGHDGLHFSPPLIGRNPTPVSEARADYFLTDLVHDEGTQHTFRFLGEYAFTPSFSMEIGIPYTILDPNGDDTESNLDNVDIGVKYANFAFAEKGIVLGGGVEVGLPTGEPDKHIGSDEVVEIEPFISLGWKNDELELVGAIGFGVLVNGDATEADWELIPNATILYHLTPRLRPFLEFDGERIYGGKHGGDLLLNLTPGLKWQPWEDDHNLELGLGLSLPLTTDKESHVTSVLTVFYHF